MCYTLSMDTQPNGKPKPSKTIGIRLKLDEYHRIKAAAHANLDSMSAWVRRVVSRALKS